MQITQLVTIGVWFFNKHRAQQSEAGTFHVAQQLRKRGVPLHIALLVLCGGAR